MEQNQHRVCLLPGEAASCTEYEEDSSIQSIGRAAGAGTRTWYEPDEPRATLVGNLSTTSITAMNQLLVGAQRIAEYTFVRVSCTWSGGPPTEVHASHTSTMKWQG